MKKLRLRTPKIANFRYAVPVAAFLFSSCDKSNMKIETGGAGVEKLGDIKLMKNDYFSDILVSENFMNSGNPNGNPIADTIHQPLPNGVKITASGIEFPVFSRVDRVKIYFRNILNEIHQKFNGDL